MRITTPLTDIKDQLIIFISEGYGILGFCFGQGLHSGQYALDQKNNWANCVRAFLNSRFPSKKEEGEFDAKLSESYYDKNMDSVVQSVVGEMNYRIKILEKILDKLTIYYQFEPDTKRLYIENIDNFSSVRGINHNQVAHFLQNGFLDMPEATIKQSFASILGELYIASDHGGETEDIFTPRILLNGQREQASIILKGRGTIVRNVTQLRDLGKNGDQIVRMFSNYASKIYIIQSVKPFAPNVVASMETHIDQHRANNHHAYYCCIDGQDTAKILYAYGFLQ